MIEEDPKMLELESRARIQAERERDEWKQNYHDLTRLIDKGVKENNDLRAEVERLKAALD